MVFLYMRQNVSCMNCESKFYLWLQWILFLIRVWINVKYQVNPNLTSGLMNIVCETCHKQWIRFDSQFDDFCLWTVKLVINNKFKFYLWFGGFCVSKCQMRYEQWIRFRMLHSDKTCLHPDTDIIFGVDRRKKQVSIHRLHEFQHRIELTCN